MTSLCHRVLKEFGTPGVNLVFWDPGVNLVLGTLGEDPLGRPSFPEFRGSILFLGPREGPLGRPSFLEFRGYPKVGERFCIFSFQVDPV